MAKGRLSVERVRDKIRYAKMHDRKRWKSPTYHADTRDNERAAWKLFSEWRDEQTAKQAETDQPKKLAAELEQLSRTDLKHHLSDLLAKTAEHQRKAEVLKQAAENPTVKVLEDAIAEFQPNIDPTYETANLVEQWLGFRLSDVKVGDITAGTLDNNRMQLQRFATFCPDIREVDGMKFLEFRQMLQNEIASGKSAYTQRDVLATVKNFLEWCADTPKVINPIANLRKRGTGIKVPKKKAISIWDDDAITDLLSSVSGQQKLYYLLMLNTGAYESDIGTWTKIATDDKGRRYKPFDPEAGTITFKRHKEKDQPNVPTVTYKLWPTTATLLAECVSTHPTLLLTTKKGSILWIDELKKDTGKKRKRHRKNVIGRQFGRLRENHPTWGTLDDLRKTAISKLDEHGEYARYAQYFGGHAPTGTTDRFYRKPSQTQFDMAVSWLGEQFGQLQPKENLLG